MNIRKYLFSYSLVVKAFFILAMTQSIKAELKVVTTSQDLASIAKEIGADLVRVESLSKGNNNLHYLSARPDYILKVNRADVFVMIGMDMEVGWVPKILKQSRNKNIQRGGAGYCNASKGIPVLGKPQGLINRAMGDIHIHGNPHYWTDPLRGVIIARNILNTLKRVDITNKDVYEKNFNIFKAKVTKLFKRLKKMMLPHKNKSVVAYHNEFIYMTKRFNLKIAGYIEEKPGVSPSASHIRKIVNIIKENKIKIIFNTPWQNVSYSEEVSRKSGAKVLLMPIQTGSSSRSKNYLQMIEECVRLIAQNL